MDWARWQALWDAQQQAHLPDREQRFCAMLDVVEVVTAGWPRLGAGGDTAPEPTPGATRRAVGRPRILDLAGGTGSITRRALERFPDASSVVLDVDPALLAIAAGTLSGDDRVRICRADLATPGWVESLGAKPGSFDAILTATALHWLPAERVAGVYAESFPLLEGGGVLVNADHLPDGGLGALGDALRAREQERRAEERAGERDAASAAVPALGWEEWWAMLAEEPEVAALVAERNRHFAERAGNAHAQSELDAAWHRRALRAAGFARVGIVWRHLGDAVVVAQRD